MLTGVNTWYRPDGRLDAGAIEARYLAMARGLVGVGAEATGRHRAAPASARH
jgi:hypothetical protein